MKLMCSNKKKKNIKIIIFIEIIVALFFGVLIFTPKKTYTIFPEDGNTIKLVYGHYYITCEFEVDKDIQTVNYLHIQDLSGSKKHIAQNDNYLNADNNSYTTEFWINSICNTVELSVREIGQNVESQSAHIKRYEIKSTGYSAFIGFITMITLIAFTMLWYYVRIGKIKLTRENIRNITVITVAFLISCFPLAGNDLLRGDDTLVHLIRLEGIKDGYLAGQFPVKVEPTFNGGYGYAFSIYYGSLYYNIPAFLRLMGFSIQNAYKAYVIIVNLATLLISFYSFKIIFRKSEHALTGSILYSLSIYRIYDLYQRGAVGEYTAMVFLPLIAAGLWKIYTTPTDDKNYSRLWIMPVIGYSGVIESHVLSTELYGAFTILLCLIMAKRTFRKKTFIVLLKVLVITVVLNIGYILPFLESYLCEDVVINSNIVLETNLSQRVPIEKMFSFFIGDYDDNIWWRSNLIGTLGPTVPTVLVLIVYNLKNKMPSRDKRFLGVMGIITLVGTIMSLDIIPWDKILSSMYYGMTGSRIINAILQKISLLFINVQFSVRFLIVPIVTYTIMTCIVLSQKDDYGILKFSKYLLIGLTVIQFIYAGIFIMIKSERVTINTISSEDKEVTCNIGNYEYIPLKGDGDMPYVVTFRQPLSCLTTNVELMEYRKEYTNIYIHLRAEKDGAGIVELPLLYYRGYKAVDTDTGKEMMVFKSMSNARLGVVVDSGYEGNIKVYYAGKTSWHIAEIVSCITFCIIVIYWIINKKNNR